MKRKPGRGEKSLRRVRERRPAPLPRYARLRAMVTLAAAVA